ncbi:MAG: EAL and HDOD domain-containing protein [Candidatus Sulfotelmatobacter sp.]
MPNPAHAVAPEKPSACIARQPILTADEQVIGYELFFREDREQRRFSSDRENATSATIDMLNFVGLGVLCDGRLAFINCSHDMLLSDYFALLPPTEVVIEIQETVPVDQDVITACEKLQQAGYAIALDNFVPDDKREALIPYARFIKVDISRVLPDPCVALVKRYAREQCRMVAQRVETRDQFLIARKDGFTRFQGYFFRHPENMQARRIPANQMTYVKLLAAVSKPKIDFAEIEALIKHEPALCYQLLRYLNSPLLGLSSPVLSVRNALTLLGERETVRWIRMATTLVMGQQKSSDLVLSSLVRARFCELISPKVKHGNSDLFLMGMLSLIDAILAVPIGMVVDELALDADVKAQLLAAKSDKKTPLSPIYELMVAREVGDWGLVTRLGKQLNISLSFVADASNQAMRWAHEVTSAARPEPPR